MYNTKKMNLSDVLQMLLQHSGVTESELSRKICIPCATLNKLKTGKINDPRSSTLLIIAKYFDISVDQLLGNIPIDLHSQECLMNLPIITADMLFTEMQNNEQSMNITNCFKTTVSVAFKQHKLFVFQVAGDAMSPYFDENTMIVVDRDYNSQSKNFVLVYIHNTNEILVRQLLIDGKCKLLKPINNIFPTTQLSANDKIIGVIINSIKHHC